MMDTWCFKFYHWNRNDQPRREALCTVGNGYFATRDAAEESFPGECHYPGTYLAGHYNQLASVIAHHEVIHEDMVNWPNWLSLTFSIDGDVWFDLQNVHIMHYQQVLDMHAGVLTRHIVLRMQSTFIWEYCIGHLQQKIGLADSMSARHWMEV